MNPKLTSRNQQTKMDLKFTSASGSCRCMLIAFILLVWVFGLSPFAYAHKVTVFAWVEGETIHTQCKFSGGKKVKNGQVMVSDLKGNQLLEGKTDDNGEFSFTVPKKTTLNVAVIAGMGHRGEWTIPVEEIDPTAEIPAQPVREAGVDPARQPPPIQSASADEPVMVIEAQRVQQLVEDALDKKLKPITAMLADARHDRPTMKDIFGGIGYIFGLVGVAAWVNSRKKNKE